MEFQPRDQRIGDYDFFLVGRRDLGSVGHIQLWHPDRKRQDVCLIRNDFNTGSEYSIGCLGRLAERPSITMTWWPAGISFSRIFRSVSGCPTAIDESSRWEGVYRAASVPGPTRQSHRLWLATRADPASLIFRLYFASRLASFPHPASNQRHSRLVRYCFDFLVALGGERKTAGVILLASQFHRYE